MRSWLPVAAVLLAAQAAPALADRDPYSGAPLRPAKKHPATSPITDHFYIIGAWYGPTLRTNFRVDSTARPGMIGTPLNAENDFGLPRRVPQGTVEFMFRLRERNKVRVDYFEANRSASRVLSREIVFGNETFAAGQLAQSTLNWQQFDITYTYSFIRNNRFEVGTGVALYFIQLDAIGQVLAQSQYQEVSAATPFPALPVDFTWSIAPRWSATAHGAYLKTNAGGFHGWYANYEENVQYRWNPNFAVGLGYSSTRTSLTRRGGSYPGVFDFSVNGPQAFIRFSF